MTHKIRLLIIDSANILPPNTISMLARSAVISLIGLVKDWGSLKALSDGGQLPDLVLYSIAPASNLECIFDMLGGCGPGIKSILLIRDEDDPNLLYALKHGSDGYLKNTVSAQVLLQAVISVYRGEAVLSPRILTKILDQIKEQQ